jgi:addiction module HigA family antidote
VKKIFRILLINPNSEGRGRLREALQSVVHKGSYTNSRELKHAFGELGNSEEKYDFAFLSTEFSSEPLLEFLGSVKTLSAKRRPILVLCLKPNDQNSSLVANLYANGAHGFVSEPYSPDGLMRAMEIAEEKSAGPTEGKEVRIAEFLLSDAMRWLDKVAERLSEGKRGGGVEGKELRRVAKSLQEASTKIDPVRYQKLLIEMFGRAETKKKGIEPAKVKKKIVEAPHPGDELRAIMAQRGLSKEKLLATMKVPGATLDALLSEQTSLTEEVARELARALGKTSKYWMNMQAAYDKMKKDKEEAAKKATI